jgi:hypothetical protein
MYRSLQRSLLILFVLIPAIDTDAQRSNESGKNNTLPKEVRGYKVHRAEVEMKPTESDKKRPEQKNGKEQYDEDEPLLVRLGEAQLVSVSPLGVTFDVPVVVGVVKQQGDIDRLVFEDIRVNDISVRLADYVHPFALPNKEPVALARPLRIFVSTPQAVLRTIDDLLDSKDVWEVTGRIYVCGHFKKYLFKVKRAVPVELQTSINNPLR